MMNEKGKSSLVEEIIIVLLVQKQLHLLDLFYIYKYYKTKLDTYKILEL